MSSSDLLFYCGLQNCHIYCKFVFQEREAEEESTGEPSDKPQEKVLTPLERWETSLMSSSSYAQLYIHLTTLENSIIWSK